MLAHCDAAGFDLEGGFWTCAMLQSNRTDCIVTGVPCLGRNGPLGGQLQHAEATFARVNACLQVLFLARVVLCCAAAAIVFCCCCY